MLPNKLPHMWPVWKTRTQVAELVAQLVSSVNGSSNILGHKLSNKLLNLLLVWTVPLKYMANTSSATNLLLNLLSNMWPVWKHYNVKSFKALISSVTLWYVFSRPTFLLGSHTYSVTAFCFGRRICHQSVLRQILETLLHETRVKFCCPLRKSGLPSNNMTSDFSNFIGSICCGHFLLVVRLRTD